MVPSRDSIIHMIRTLHKDGHGTCLTNQINKLKEGELVHFHNAFFCLGDAETQNV